MRSTPARANAVAITLAITLVALLGGCGDDDGGSSTTETTSDTASGGFEQEAFCDAAGDFATASDGAPEESTPSGVEERVTAMSAAADALVDTAPADITEEAQAFADAIDGLEQYAAERDYEVRLGGGSPEYQSGDGAVVVDAITNTIAPVDQAVQDECDRFLSEAP